MAQTLTQSGPDQIDADQIDSFVLARSAWMPILRGAVALLFGLVALFWPGIALPVLVALFGIYAFADGFLAMVSSFRKASRHNPFVALLLEGVVGIAAGILVFRTPGLAAVALVYAVGAWAVVTGCLEIVTAIELRKQISGVWALGVSGLLSVLLGWLLFAQPLAGVATLVWIIGLYGVFFGALMIYGGIQLRRLSGRSGPGDAFFGA